VIARWAKNILAAAGVKARVEGLERLPAGTFVLAGNHQSNFDPVMVFALVPRHMRFVAKAELFKIPLFGQVIKHTGNIRVERRGGEKDRQTLQDAVRDLREKVSVVFYPEGTRSQDGELRPFKKGAAMLAIQAQVPIVPMAVAGTAEILEKGSAWVRGGQPAALVIGEAIPTEGKDETHRDALTEQLRSAVEGLLPRARAMLKE
jgi:1-acyl-sn-glycerol-3-phosphate acyltransferase